MERVESMERGSELANYSNDINALERFFESYRDEIERSIEDFVLSEIEPSYREEVKYIVEGGKRLRGVIIMLISESLGGDKSKALKAATAIEVVHSASLAIDDIIDMDRKRRGRDSSWVAFGVGKTILITNIVIPKAIEMVFPLGELAVREVISTWVDVSKGELFDSYYDEVDYLNIINLKTSRMYELAFVLGALTAGQTKLVNPMREIGKKLGELYQILDDYADSVLADKKGEKERVSLKKFHRWLGFSEGFSDTKQLSQIIKELTKSYLIRINFLIESVEHPNIKGVLRPLPHYIVEKVMMDLPPDFKFAP